VTPRARAEPSAALALALPIEVAPDYESGGQEFESLRARQQHIDNTTDC
jgi:hypothetical protein